MLVIKAVLVGVDMEGCSLVKSKRQVFTDGIAPVEFGRQAMEHDLNAVLEGLSRAGVERVFIVDWHDTGRNIRRKNLRTCGMKVGIFRGDSLRAFRKLSGKIDAVVCIGSHARAGAREILAHTMSFEIGKFLIDGKPSGETALDFRTASFFKKPIILVCGSYDATKEARAISKEVRTVATKRGFRLYPRAAVRDELVRKTIGAVKHPAGPIDIPAGKMVVVFKDGSRRELEGRDFVGKFRHMNGLIERYLKEKGIYDDNSFILRDLKIR